MNGPKPTPNRAPLVQPPILSSASWLADSTAGGHRRILWVDGVGGFLLIDREEVVVGQAISGSTVDLPIVGDLRRQAAVIRRSGEDYLLRPLQAAWLYTRGEKMGMSLDRPHLLSDGNTFQIGERVKLRFSKPSPLSATARLELSSVNRFRPNVDAALLLADTCILGPGAGSHIFCADWSAELLLFRQGSSWFFRPQDSVDVGGKVVNGQIPVVAGMRIRGEDFSISIE